MKNIFIKKSKGFTLLEILVAISIFLLIVGGITTMLMQGLRSNKIVLEQLSTQNEGRTVVKNFTNELRRAVASSIGSYPLEIVEPQQLVFYSNIDSDSWRERVRYFLDGDILKKGITKPSGNPLVYDPTTEIITNVALDIANGVTPVFYYYDENFTGVEASLSAPVNVSNVRIIKISLDLEEDPYASPEPLHVETLAEIRNLKSN